MAKKILRIIFLSALALGLFFFILVNSSDKNQNLDVYIPEMHWAQRYDYLEMKDIETNWNENSTIISGLVKNNSYIYNLDNVIIRFDFFADENKETLIDSLQHDVGFLKTSDETDFYIEFDSEEPVATWEATYEGVELLKKE
jgi:hypothetical protein